MWLRGRALALPGFHPQYCKSNKKKKSNQRRGKYNRTILLQSCCHTVQLVKANIQHQNKTQKWTSVNCVWSWHPPAVKEGSGNPVWAFKLGPIYCHHPAFLFLKCRDNFGSWVICKTAKFIYKNMKVWPVIYPIGKLQSHHFKALESGLFVEALHFRSAKYPERDTPAYLGLKETQALKEGLARWQHALDPRPPPQLQATP